MTFELFIAIRYLRARRKEAVISIITAISVIGVAAGVMALVVSLAINNGFRSTLQRNLLGATAHVNILSKEVGVGIEDWRALSRKLQSLQHVTSVEPVLYGQVFLTGPAAGKGIVLKGVITGSQSRANNTLQHLKEGSLEHLENADGLPGIVLGARLATDAGLVLNSRVMILSPNGPLTPFGPTVGKQNFRVVGIFESGFYDTDDNWAYASMTNVQKLLSLRDVVNAIELRLDNVNLAREVATSADKVIGSKYTASPWEEQNQQIMKALNMERIVTVITIGLIELIAALNTGHDGDGEVSRYRDLDFHGHPPSADQADFCDARSANRLRWNVGRVNCGLHILLPRRLLPTDSAGRPGIRAQLRSIRTKVA